MATNQQIATRPDNPLVQFREELEQRSNELRMALPSHISRDKFQRTMITAAQQNPGLLNASRKSLMLACMKSAQDGLLPDGREAALVPFKTSKKVNGQWLSLEEVAYIPMAFGIRKKILQARDAEGKPVVSALQVGVVYRREVEEGHFLYEVGLTPPLRHRPMLDLTAEDTTDDKIVGAYSIAFMVDGPPSYEFMRRFEIDRVRESSQTGATKDRNGQPRTPKGPWVDHFSEMAKKTVLRRHSKTLPQSGDLIIETDDDEFDSGVSAVAVLASRDEDAPRSIEDQTPHDPETGEVIDETDEQPQAEQKPARTKPKAVAQAEPEEQPDADEEQEPTLAEETGLDPVADAEHPAKAIADAIIAEINSPETNAVLDVGAILNRNALDMAAMPDELAVAIEIAADKKRAQIRAEQQKAKSRETAE